MRKKKLMVGILAISMMLVVGGCGKTDEVPETPTETPVEAPIEAPIEAPVETPVEVPAEVPEEVETEPVYEGKYWDVVESKSQTELEESEDVYFVNTKLDQVDGSFEITASKIYFVDEGLFVELNLNNGTEIPRTNIILEEFSLNEVVDYDEELEEGTTVTLLDKVHIGAFRDVVVNPGEAKLITFVVPYDELQNEVYNFDRVNYGWGFNTAESDVYSLKPADTGIEAPEESPIG